MKNLLLILPLLIVGCATTSEKIEHDAYDNIAVAKAKLAKLSDEEKQKMAEDVRKERLFNQPKDKPEDTYLFWDDQLNKIIKNSERIAKAKENEAYIKKLEIKKRKELEQWELDRLKRIAKAKEQEARKKQQILAGLKQRCSEYGFTGESNIAACIQREAQHDKELAMQKYELEKTRLALQQAKADAQSRTYQSSIYAQNETPIEEKEEDLPFLIKFLGDVAIGVAEAYADPAFHRDVQQQKQINQLRANQNQNNDVFRNCRPNC